MKQMIPTYTFNASAKTITLGGFSTVRLDRLLLIVNVTRNVIYYNFADSSLGATVATNVITLTNVSTSGHADADKLEIFYDTVSGDPDYLTNQPVTDAEKLADNAGFTDGTTKVQPVGYVFDEVAGTALTENDIAAARLDSKRAQVAVIEDATTRGRRATVTAGGLVAVDASGAAVPVTDNSGSLTVDSNLKLLYGTEAQAFTITLASLASSATAGRESTAVVNTSNLFTDVLVMGRVKLQAGTIGNDKRVYIWAYGTVDGTTPVYPDTVTGSDAAITMNSPVNLRLLGVIECPAQSTSYTAGPWSLAQLFGSVPQKFGIVVQNYTNIALSSTESDMKMLYQGVKAQLA